MYVCSCRQVTDFDAARAIAQGARTVAELSAATGAGTCCGSCRPTLERLVSVSRRADEGESPTGGSHPCGGDCGSCSSRAA